MKRAIAHRQAPVHEAFPLRTVAAMTGLTPDLIRAWEKRYAVVAPIRGARGARLYSSADIAHLRVIARVVGAGRAIGDVAALGRAELEKLAAQPEPNAPAQGSGAAIAPRDDFVARVVERLEHFDHAAVTCLLGDAVIALGVRRFVHQVVLPLVRHVGSRWVEGELSIAQEHLLTGMLRGLLANLANLANPAHGRRGHGHGHPLLLATPAGERHEIGLLGVALLARDAGVQVVHLGVDLPAAEIVAAAAGAGAGAVGLSVATGRNRARACVEVAAVQAALPADVELWLGGADSGNVAAEMKGFRGLVLNDLEATEAELARIAVRSVPESRQEVQRR